MFYLFNIFKSKYCIGIFVLSLILTYFLIPGKAFYEWYILLDIAFMVSFALVITCIVRNVKEKILLAKTYKTSILGIVATAVGLSALQVCGFGAPVCGAVVGAGIISSIFPAVFLNLLEDYSVIIIILSIAFQLIALFFMGCFKKNLLNKKQTK